MLHCTVCACQIETNKHACVGKFHHLLVKKKKHQRESSWAVRTLKSYTIGGLHLELQAKHERYI